MPTRLHRTPELLLQLEYEFADDGTFWMDLFDFVTKFNIIYAARLFGSGTEGGGAAAGDAAAGGASAGGGAAVSAASDGGEGGEWSRQSIRGAWAGASAAGCCKHEHWRDNPCVAINLTAPTSISALLSQPDQRTAIALMPTSSAAEAAAQVPSIGFMVTARSDLRPRGGVKASSMCIKGLPFRAERDGTALRHPTYGPRALLYLCPSRLAAEAQCSRVPVPPPPLPLVYAVGSSHGEVLLPAGEYVLVPFTFERGQEGAFTVEVRSSRPCELQMLPSVHSAMAPPEQLLHAEEEDDDEDEDVWAERVELPDEDPNPSARLAGSEGFTASKHERKHERKARHLSAAYLEQQCTELIHQGDAPIALNGMPTAASALRLRASARHLFVRHVSSP